MFKNLKHIKDWNFYEKIFSLIADAIITVFAINSDIPLFLKNIVWIFIIGYFILTLLRMIKIYNTHTKNIFHSDNEIKK